MFSFEQKNDQNNVTSFFFVITVQQFRMSNILGDFLEMGIHEFDGKIRFLKYLERQFSI